MGSERDTTLSQKDKMFNFFNYRLNIAFSGHSLYVKKNERGIIRISAHPEAEKPEEQHHNTQHAPTQFLLACAGCWLLFELWGLKTCLDLLKSFELRPVITFPVNMRTFVAFV
jgi:hypothetical protein